MTWDRFSGEAKIAVETKFLHQYVSTSKDQKKSSATNIGEEIVEIQTGGKRKVIENDSSSEEDDDTGLFLDAESGILETPEESPKHSDDKIEFLDAKSDISENSRECPDSSEDKDDSIVILDSTPPPPPTQKVLGIRKDLFEQPKNQIFEGIKEVSVAKKESSKDDIPDINLMAKQLEHNQQQIQKLSKLLTTTGNGVMLPDKGKSHPTTIKIFYYP